MTLGELIAELKKCDPATVIRHGFATPHSYRGYYDQLEFTPAENVTVASMLEFAEGAVGKEFTGYKGGEYLMDAYTEVWLGEYGKVDGEMITKAALNCWLNH